MTDSFHTCLPMFDAPACIMYRPTRVSRTFTSFIGSACFGADARERRRWHGSDSTNYIAMRAHNEDGQYGVSGCRQNTRWSASACNHLCLEPCRAEPPREIRPMSYPVSLTDDLPAYARRIDYYGGRRIWPHVTLWDESFLLRQGVTGLDHHEDLFQAPNCTL